MTFRVPQAESLEDKRSQSVNWADRLIASDDILPGLPTGERTGENAKASSLDFEP